MTDHWPQLLAEIIARPLDDDIRLVAADWLEEQGDPRGEFIRVQCELARNTHNRARRRFTTPCGECDRVLQLHVRERELLEANGVRWLTESGIPAIMRFAYRRGFVEVVTCSWADWLAHADALQEATPLLEVRLLDVAELLAIANLVMGIHSDKYLKERWPDFHARGGKFVLPQVNVQDQWLAREIDQPTLLPSS